MSPRAACRLESLGFKQVYDYVTGLADWTANGLPTEGVQAGVLRAGDVVRREVPTCGLEERVADVARRLQAAGQDVCIVTSDEGVVLGRLRGDALKGDADTSAEAAMESGPTTIRPDVPAAEYAAHMRATRVASVVVTTSTGQLLGLLYRRDVEERLGEASPQ